jgi:hypothetical protein
MLNKYKFTDTSTEFLCYSDNEIKFPEDIPVETIEENVDPSKHGDLPILHFESLLIRGMYQKARTLDKILEENNCLTFNQLSASYFLIKTKQLNKPRSVREAIERKYDSIIQYISPPGNIVPSDGSSGEQESSS